MTIVNDNWKRPMYYECIVASASASALALARVINYTPDLTLQIGNVMQLKGNKLAAVLRHS
jgi:hypothetical protein